MRIVNNASLIALNTLRVPARARALARLDHWYEAEQLLDNTLSPPPWLVIGGGSNVLFRGDFPGTILLIANRGIRQVAESSDESILRVAAGENWDRFVHWCADRQLWGVENLALIPGTVGAAPIQNIGAYGVEIAQCIRAVKAFDMHQRKWVDLTRTACRFGYRSSIFKEMPDRYMVTEVTMVLGTQANPILDYPGVRESLGEMETMLTPGEIANAISDVRRSKLPDPATSPNAGSFFKNPIVAREKWDSLRAEHPKLPAFEVDEGIKLSAAWLMDRAGLKGAQVGGAEVSRKHALVLVNRGDATGMDVWRLARRCQDQVYDQFGIILEPEPLIV